MAIFRALKKTRDHLPNVYGAETISLIVNSLLPLILKLSNSGDFVWIQ